MRTVKAKPVPLMPLQSKITVTTALDAKMAIIRDLTARAELFTGSANSKGHSEAGRNGLLLVARALEVAISDYANNLVCF